MLRLLVEKCFDLNVRMSPASWMSESSKVAIEIDSHG